MAFHQRISRVFALWLVALIVLPFTAPWGTCDLADLTGGHSSQDDSAKTNPSPDETFVGPEDASLVPPALNLIVRTSIDLPDRIDILPTRHIVLRV